MTQENTNRTNIQTFGTTTVRIMKSQKGGARFAEIRPTNRPAYYVPVELLALAGGKDAWMRKIQVRCTGCRTYHIAENLNDGCYCPACVDAQDEENERLNGGTPE